MSEQTQGPRDLAAALKAVAAAARRWIQCLEVERQGIGRRDPDALYRAAVAYEQAIDTAAALQGEEES